MRHAIGTTAEGGVMDVKGVTINAVRHVGPATYEHTAELAFGAAGELVGGSVTKALRGHVWLPLPPMGAPVAQTLSRRPLELTPVVRDLGARIRELASEGAGVTHLETHVKGNIMRVTTVEPAATRFARRPGAIPNKVDLEVIGPRDWGGRYPIPEAPRHVLDIADLGARLLRAT